MQLHLTLALLLGWLPARLAPPFFRPEPGRASWGSLAAALSLCTAWPVSFACPGGSSVSTAAGCAAPGSSGAGLAAGGCGTAAKFASAAGGTAPGASAGSASGRLTACGDLSTAAGVSDCAGTAAFGSAFGAGAAWASAPVVTASMRYVRLSCRQCAQTTRGGRHAYMVV